MPPFRPAVRIVVVAAQGSTAPLAASTAPMPYAAEPLSCSKEPPRITRLLSGDISIAATIALEPCAAGAQGSTDLIVGEKAARPARVCPPAETNAPPT